MPGDGGLPNDAQFYGEVAEPMADSYPREEQKKLYEMTKHMRAGYSGDKSLIARGINKIKRVLNID